MRSEASEQVVSAGEKRDSLETVTIITCEPNAVMKPIHDRMPVILEQENEREWLSAEPAEAQALLDPYDGDDLQAYPVSNARQ